METRSNHILVGGVVLALLAVLAAFTVWLAGLSGGAQKEYDIFFSQSVDGLAKGGTVTYSGVPSGQVKGIELWRDNPGFVRVRIEVRPETPVLIGTTASIQGSFTGPSSILLDGAVKGAPPITEMGPAGVAVIPAKRTGLGALLNSAPQLMERISGLTEKLTDLLDDRNQKSFRNILANTDKLSSELARSGPDIRATIAQTQIAIRQAASAADSFAKVAGTASTLMDQEGKPMIADLRKAAKQAESSLASLDATVKDVRPGVQTFSTQTLPEIGQLVRDLRVMTESLTSLSVKIDQGGAGALLSSPQLPEYKPGRKSQ